MQLRKRVQQYAAVKAVQEHVEVNADLYKAAAGGLLAGIGLTLFVKRGNKPVVNNITINNQQADPYRGGCW